MSFRHLFYLLCHNDYHDFFCDLEEIEKSPIFKILTSDEKSIIFEYYEKIITNSINSFDITITEDSTDATFNLVESIRYLNQPVSIILENSNNDKYFLEALFKNFKTRSKQINKHIKAGDLVYVMAGGKENIQHLLTAKLDEFKYLPKEKHKYLRAIVIFDSDKLFPSPNSSNNKLIDSLTDLEISYHELEKREMENYMPDIIFFNINDEFCRKYLEMNPIQKDFFDIQNGFKDKDINDFPVPIQELYNQMSDDNFSYFRKNEFQIEGSFKADFPKFFLSDDVNQENLKHRVSHQENPNELEEILDKINQLL
jgi:hypothetical protein